MGCIVVAMPKLEDAQRISETFRRRGVEVNLACTMASEVLYEVQLHDDSIVICGTRLKDMGYLELAEYLPELADMILLTHDTSMYNDRDNIVNMIMPFKTSDLISTINMLIMQHERVLRKKKDKPKPRNSADKADIDKAKLILMERNDMTEPEAYRYIQKCSMDSGTNMVETAQMILLLHGED